MDEVLRAKRQPNAGSASRAITIRGAREHNLKNIDVEIPRDKLAVFTGLSGSGKSSLAFDTIYAEGQRRYVESLSAYARQFLEMMQKPDVDQIDGLSPAISIEQKTTSKNPRSTVGTVTEIYDYMRLLWARVGVPYSPATGLPIESQIVSQMVDRVLALPEGTRLYLLAPVVRGRKGEYKKELAEWLKKGFQRVKIDGTFYELAEAPTLDKKFPHDIDVVVDRIVVRPDIGQRLAESFETALKLAEGLAVIEYADAPAGAAEEKKSDKKTAKIHDKSGPERILFSEKFACPVSGFTIPEIEPRLFSFNNPYGACPACGGLGVEQHIDEDLVIPDKEATLRKGAIAPWAKSSSPYYIQTLTALGKFYKFTLDTKWKDLPKKTQSSDCCTAPATTRSNSPTRTASAPTTPRNRSRASSPTSSAASARPRANGRARSWQSISPTFPAGHATAIASSPSRCASRSAASTSAKSRNCRCFAPANGSRPCRRRSTRSRTRSPRAC